MPLIAVTGGIASGKSTVAQRLGGLGAVVVDADAIAREVVAVGQPALTAIRHAFGEQVMAEDGSLNRGALGAIVFADPSARQLLNGIVHPSVLYRSQARFRDALDRDRHAVVVYDVPLIDARGTEEFDRVVVTEAPMAKRIERLTSIRGMTEEDARARIAAQIGDEERRALATDVIDTGGSLAATTAATDELWRRLRPSAR